MYQLERYPSSKFVVSWWHIPRGTNYHAAYVVQEYCDTQEEADALAKERGLNPPEMAVVIPINELKGTQQ